MVSAELEDQPIVQQAAIFRTDGQAIDAKSLLTAEDPMSFALSMGAQPGAPNAGYSRQVSWLVVELSNPASTPLARYVVLRRGAKHQVDAMLATDAAQGFSRLSQRPASRHYVAPMSIAAGDRVRLLLRVESFTGLSLDLHLWSESKLQREALLANWLLGSMHGAQFVLGLYMLFLFSGSRDLRYLLTAATAMCNAVYQSHFEGTAFAAVWGTADLSVSALSFLMGGVASACNLALLRAMIASRRWLPRIDRYFLFPAVLAFLCLALSWSVAPVAVNRINALLHMVSGLMILAAVATVYLRGQVRIKSYLIGVLLNLLVLLFFVGKQAGWVSDNPAFDWLLPLISLVATILFSVAVAERFRSELEANRQAIQRNEARLSDMVEARTAELSTAKETAEKALLHLIDTQKQLVQSAKLASLGQLVAGVAHEINTPVGVALTASSHLSAATREARAELQQATMTKTGLNRYFELAQESSGMIERNLDRAARLVQSFKQVSVDRSNDLAREIDLRQFIDELLASSASLWRGRPIEVNADVPDELHVLTYPGSLGQVLINLLQNALIHGLAASSAGVITVSARRRAQGGVLLECHDNGEGIRAEHLSQIFEPFFTTRRNRGGTGLGLHIVHNLVTHKLCGEIRVESEPGKGTRVQIELPDRVDIDSE
ncbi:sensor histidine kinase [Pseudomarimonas arenosa]|uniref:histidine kinase n=1 Tax=Pseudomarimonas arenosa TaxID=2774145 RepID=A0AAW3ZKA8_9GAMM|nr:sensor histidine kinase [Pseudomarimonas arenosa]MBD8525949.1 sensor histidine kinase [Pseudomarimonas arenosa]